MSRHWGVATCYLAGLEPEPWNVRDKQHLRQSSPEQPGVQGEGPGGLDSLRVSGGGEKGGLRPAGRQLRVSGLQEVEEHGGQSGLPSGQTSRDLWVTLH